MRIAFDHQIFSWQEYGGVSRYAFEVAAELAVHLGQDVAVIAPLFVNQYLRAAPPQLKVLGRAVPAVRGAGRVFRDLTAPLALPLLHRFAPDIVHETYYSFLRLAPRRSRVVLTVYDMIHERFQGPLSWLDPTRREKAAAVARADHIICISAQTRDDLLSILKVDPAKTSVVHLGFTLTAPAAVASFKAPPRPFLLYVGKRGGYKNFAGLLRAVAASPALRRDFDVVCFGGGKFTPAERWAVRRLGLAANQVRQVSGNDAVLAELYRRARGFVYPSLYEGFGIPPLEAMSFDCPAACSDASSMPEVVGDAALLFDAREVDAIRRAVERVVFDEVLRGELIARGRRRLEQFSWARCARETLSVYQRVMG